MQRLDSDQVKAQPKTLAPSRALAISQAAIILLG
jgi:hypothetical protein